MKIFLLWHRTSDRGRKPDPHHVASSLEKMFSPLFSTPLVARTQQNAVAVLVFLELPVRGWKPPFFQEDDRTWAFTVDYPINVRRILSANGIRHREDNVLPSLGRALQHTPAPLLREMAPPMSLLWASKQTDEIFVQNDGLGQAQLYEYQDNHFWALTNKIASLEALGIKLKLNRDDWAVRCTLGSFALERTGFENTRILAPGSQLRLDAGGLHRMTHDVLSEWVNPEGISKQACFELARAAMLQQIDDVMPLWERPLADLTAGFDSRAVVSSLRLVNADFSLRVKGLPGKFDVEVASDLARIAGVELRIDRLPELPPDTAVAAKSSIQRALLWQTGNMWTERQKSLFSQHPFLDGGEVNIKGDHGAIGKGGLARKIGAAELEEGQYEDALVGLLMAEARPFLKKALHDPVYEFIRMAYRQADRYGLVGLARLDFWFLFERTRRYNGASIASLPGLVFAPFMNPDYIRASYAYRAQGGVFHQLKKSLNPFHRYIIETNAPEWMDISYEKDLIKRANKERRSIPVDTPDVPEASSTNWKRSNGKDYYDYALYWQVIGKPLIDEAIAHGGFWTEIFEPDLAQSRSEIGPNELTMLYLLPQVLGI